ncbi:hypothetical protein ACGE0T_13960 [Parabacteroides sp. APC149_11_2_Y6]
MKKILLLLTLLLSLNSTVWGQTNEVKAYFQVGDNALHGIYGGFSGFYTRNFSDRLSLTGGLNLSTKNPQAFGGLYADGTYRFSVYKFNVYISNRLVYNYYGLSKMNELLYRIAGTWESRYFNLTLGNSFLGYFSKGSGNFEPVTLSVAMGLHLRPRENWWNVGLFIRNFDDFIYENYNIMYGVDGRIDVAKHWRILAEFTARPAGSMNQLAMKYETFFKLGARYKW